MARKSMVIDAEWKSDLGKRGQRLASLFETFLRDAALGLEGQIKANIASKGIVDTGNYLNSWHVEVHDRYDVSVISRAADLSSPVNYGIFHEFGTHAIRPRPHVVPAVERIHPLLQANLAVLKGIE